MAIYNEVLSPRYSNFMQKLFGMKGSAAVKQLAGEITPTFNFFGGVENRYLESWNRFGFGVSVAAAAAIQGTLRFRNPAASNVVAVVEKIVASENAPGALRVGMVVTAADLVVIAPNAANRLDLRQQNTGPTLIISNSDATHPGSTITTLMAATTTGLSYDFLVFENQEIALLPGQAVDIWTDVVNTGLVASMMWRERFLEESERR